MRAALLVPLLLAGCSVATCDVDGLKHAEASWTFPQAADPSTVAAALRVAGWTASNDTQSVLASRPIVRDNVTAGPEGRVTFSLAFENGPSPFALLQSRVPVEDDLAASRLLGPIVDELVATLQPHLGTAQDVAYEGGPVC